MRPGKPLKRGKTLARSELKVDAEKVREFLRRGRQQGLARSGITPKVRARPLEGPLSPADWRHAVWQASAGRCVMTGARTRDADDPWFHAHHPLPKRELRARGYYGRVWDARNGVWLRGDAHEAHEHASGRVPRDRLPGSVWDFCRELDELEGTEWATVLVCRAHPARGEHGRSQAGG